MPAPDLKRSLSLMDATLINVGTMLASGIFITPSSIARDLDASLLQLAVWAGAGLFSVLGALAIAELGAMMPKAGGIYVYLERAYGPPGDRRPGFHRHGGHFLMKTRRIGSRAPILLVLAGALAFMTGSIAQETQTPAQEQPTDAIDARGYYERGLAAYQRKDYLGFLENMQKAVQLFPDHPGMIFRLAAASALVGNKDEALAQLGRLADMNIHENFAGNPDFDGLKDSAGFNTLVERMKSLKDRVGTSVTAFSLPEKDLITEGLAHDPISGDFFIGSVHKRKILRASKRGKTKEFTAEKQDGLWAVLGLKVDAKRRLLWACSSAVPQMKGPVAEELGRAALFEYNLDTGAFIRKYPLGGGASGHNCNDLTVGSGGDVFVSDAESSEVLMLATGHEELAVFLPAGQLRSPQGLAFPDDGRYLFVADYGSGIARIEMASKSLVWLSHPREVSLLGIDGLVYREGSLIAVQNGIAPHRVVRLALNPAMDRVASAKILEMSNALFDEPTLGTLTDKHLYYIANSQWSRFTREGTILPLNRLAEPVILKLGID